MEEGHKPIGEIQEGKEFKIISYNVLENRLKKDIAIKCNSGKKKLFLIEAEEGSIKASEEHIFFVREDDKIIEKKLSELKEGDVLMKDVKMKGVRIKSIKEIGIENTSDLVVLKNNNFFANGFLVHNSGVGKGLSSEAIAEVLHNNGYQILVIADPKDEIEYGFAMFEPKEQYHLNSLRIEGGTPSKKKVKLYHPFTFSIPKKKLPEINFYSLSLKDLGREEWGMLAETSFDSDTIKLIMDASQSIKKEDGLYAFLQYIQDKIRGKKDKKMFRADPDNFLLRASSGTMKSIQDVSNYFKIFKKDWFLSSDDCELKLDMQKILSDREHYHVFFTKWIKDDKLSEFTVLALLRKIIRNRDFIKYPICIIIPEVKFLTPMRPDKAYKIFLAGAITNAITTMRSVGRGISSILDAQTFSSIDEKVSSSSTDIFFGENGDPRDIEKIGKSIPFKNKKESLWLINRMDGRNRYILKGEDDVGSFKIFLPTHMHCEPEYDFFEMYRRYYPNKMRSYNNIISYMRKKIDYERNKILEKNKLEEEELKKKELEKIKKTEKKSLVKESKLKEKLNKELSEKKQNILSRILKLKEENPEISNRQIAKDVGISHVSVSNYLKRHRENQAMEKEVDFEDAFEEEN